MKADRDINKLDLKFKKKVELFMSEVKDKIFVTEAFRSAERQASLVKKGLSKVKVSNHQKGQAIDIGFLGSELYPTDINKRKEIAKIANKYGIDRGYDLWKRDKPHFQNNLQPLLNIIMGFYEEVYNQENKDGLKVIKDPKGAIERIVNKDGELNISELIYFICIGFERLGKK